MPRLQDSTTPLVFKVDSPGTTDATGTADAVSHVSFRVDVRSLAGMQKEAIVRQLSPTGTVWRMVSDEGPYLNGTDLAPFPLAFFAAGLTFCHMSQLLRLCRAAHVAVRALDVNQDTKYTMTGSALRGDMTGSGVPVALDVKIQTDAPGDVVATLIARATAESPGHAVMRDLVTNTFALQLNGQPLPLHDLPASAKTDVAEPHAGFEGVRPTSPDRFRPAIITKTETVEVQHGVVGGAGSSLASEQKRTLHVRSEARLIGDDLLETHIRLFQPLGSSFRFLTDAGGGGTAPPPLAFLSAGVGFCYMTQLGRYAHITKQKVHSTRIVQFNAYTQPGPEGGTASAEPIDTHVFIDADESAEVARKSVRMGEQTCFLHGSMREAYPTVVHAELNGDPLPLPAIS